MFLIKENQNKIIHVRSLIVHLEMILNLNISLNRVSFCLVGDVCKDSQIKPVRSVNQRSVISIIENAEQKPEV